MQRQILDHSVAAEIRDGSDGKKVKARNSIEHQAAFKQVGVKFEAIRKFFSLRNRGNYHY